MEVILNHKLIEPDTIIDNFLFFVEKSPHITWDKFNLVINNAYLVIANHGVKHYDRQRFCTFLTKSIKAEFIKDVILDIEIKLPVVIPYYYEISIVEFETKAKKRNQDHPG